MGLIAAFTIIKRRVIAAIRPYFEAPDDKTPSQFALLTNAISQQLASAIVASAKGSLLGMQGVDAKNLAHIEADMMKDGLAAQSPMLGMLMEQFPSFGRRLMKNPNLLPLLQGVLSKIKPAGTPASESADNDGHVAISGNLTY